MKVEAKRFTNVKGQAYGTARAAGAANKLKAKPVIIPIDDDMEYIEEVEEKDLKMYGVNGLLERRAKNHQDAEAVDEDTKFFAKAVEVGTKFTATKTAVEDVIEEAIVEVETTRNDYVNGLMIYCILASIPRKVSPTKIRRSNTTPSSTPLILPVPPTKDTPPITHAAMASSS